MKCVFNSVNYENKTVELLYLLQGKNLERLEKTAGYICDGNQTLISIPLFNDIEIELSKTLWEKEKMLVTSIFSFFHNVFYPFTDRNYHFSNNKFVVCKCFQFGQGQNFVVW